MFLFSAVILSFGNGIAIKAGDFQKNDIQQDSVFAIRNVTIIPMTEDNTIIQNATVVIKGKKIYIPKRPGEPRYSCASISRIKKELNWQPKISFEKGIKELIENINYWKSAPLWNKQSIKKATKIWFNNLK